MTWNSGTLMHEGRHQRECTTQHILPFFCKEWPSHNGFRNIRKKIEREAETKNMPRLLGRTKSWLNYFQAFIPLHLIRDERCCVSHLACVFCDILVCLISIWQSNGSMWTFSTPFRPLFFLPCSSPPLTCSLFIMAHGQHAEMQGHNKGLSPQEIANAP